MLVWLGFFVLFCGFFGCCFFAYYVNRKRIASSRCVNVKDGSLDSGPLAVFPIELPVSMSRCPFDQHRALCCRCTRCCSSSPNDTSPSHSVPHTLFSPTQSLPRCLHVLVPCLCCSISEPLVSVWGTNGGQW